MGMHSADKDGIANDGLDGLIRWALQDAVAGAEPSPQVWERLQQRVLDDGASAVAGPPPRKRPFTPRPWLAWLIGAGANYPVPGDPRLAWQRRLHGFDMRASLSIVRIIEGSIPVLRMVS